jgi:acyl-CoA synthetase (AMP-forming)/AMP-acid ligase II
MRQIDAFDKAAQRCPERAAIISGSSRVSYAQVKRAGTRVAARLADAGFVPGTRFGMYAPNGVTAVIAWLGALRAGGVWVSVHPDEEPRILARYLTNVGATWILFDPTLERSVAS